MEELPDDLMRSIAKKLTMKESQNLSLTDKSNRRVITKNLARKNLYKKRLRELQTELEEDIQDLNDNIDDGKVRTLEQLLKYDPKGDLLKILNHTNLVETNDAIERLKNRINSIDVNVVSKPLAKRGWRNIVRMSQVDEGAKKYKKKKKTIKKKKKKKKISKHVINLNKFWDKNMALT